MAKKKTDKKPGFDPSTSTLPGAFAKFLQGVGSTVGTAVVGAMGERTGTAEAAARMLLEDLVQAGNPALANDTRKRYEKMFPFLKPNPLGFSNPPPPFDYEKWLSGLSGNRDAPK